MSKLEFSSHGGVYKWLNADPKELSQLYPK